MHLFRVILAGLLAVGLLVWRFCLLDLNAALGWQLHLAYWSVILAIVWWVISLWQVARPVWPQVPVWIKHHRAGLMVAVACALFLQVHEPHRLKVHNDEPTHLATSLLMHEQRVAATPGSSQFFEGEFHYRQTIPMVRMFLFPVTLSLVHDISGYRVENVFILNGLLGGVLLGLVYAAGTLLGRSDRRAGLLAVLLLTGLPLLAQNTTSGGYDILNLVMLLGFFLSLRYYLSQPGVGGLNLMLSSGVLLALCRYESILYLVLAMGAAAWKWRCERRATLTWAGAVSPLAIWPCLTANFIMMNYDGFTLANMREDGSGYFDLRHWVNNASDAVYYMFQFDLGSTNSVLLSVVGGLGLLVAWITITGRALRTRDVSAAEGTFAVFSVVTAAIYGFVMTHFWSRPTDPMAARFILPLMAMMALAAPILCRELTGGRRILSSVIGIAAAFALFIGGASSALATQTSRLLTSRVYMWFEEEAGRHERETTLYVAPSSLYLLAHRYACIPTAALRGRLYEAELALEAGLYREMLILDIRWKIPETGFWGRMDDAIFPQDMKYEEVAVRRFAHGYEARVLRLVVRPRLQDDPVGGVDRPLLKRRFENRLERDCYNLSLLP